MTRSGAKENDLICVTGDLGASYLGLLLMEREKQIYVENPTIQPDFEQHTYIIERLLKPEARRKMIAWFKENKITPKYTIKFIILLSVSIFYFWYVHLHNLKISDEFFL